YDPVGMEQARLVLSNDVVYCDGPYTCAAGANALVIVTEWEQFRALDFDRIKQVMSKRPVLVDLRNIYNSDDVTQCGFVYEGVGRPRVRKPASLPEPDREDVPTFEPATVLGATGADPLAVG